MAEKIRGAMFNALGELDGLTILDAFAGSGALSFEAASRGAKQTIAIEKDRAAHKVIDRNVQDLDLSGLVKPVRANVGGWSIHNMENKFDIVILAPPYGNLHENLLRTLAIRHVKKAGILVLDWPGKLDIPEFENFNQISNKNYGDAQLVFYRRIK